MRLCFRCNEKWGQGHKCNTKVLHTMSVEDEEWQQEQLRQILRCDEIEEVEPTREVEEEQTIITVCGSDNSTSSTRTMKFKGEIGNIPVCALIDSGSTHSFVNPTVMEQLGLEICRTNPLSVIIVDGTLMSTDQLCKDVNFSLQQNEFDASLRVLDMQGYDLILGMDWLSSLGPIFIDWSEGTIKMKSKGKLVSLKVEQVNAKARVCEKIQEIEEERKKGGQVLLAHIFRIEGEEPKHSGTNSHFQPLVSEFQDLYCEPTTLPPHRTVDHQILLKPDSKPFT